MRHPPGADGRPSGGAACGRGAGGPKPAAAGVALRPRAPARGPSLAREGRGRGCAAVLSSGARRRASGAGWHGPARRERSVCGASDLQTAANLELGTAMLKGRLGRTAGKGEPDRPTSRCSAAAESLDSAGKDEPDVGWTTGRTDVPLLRVESLDRPMAPPLPNLSIYPSVYLSIHPSIHPLLRCCRIARLNQCC